MFNWLEKRRQRLKEELKREIEEDARRKEEESHPQIQRIVSEEAEKYRDSKEPWVTIIGDSISEDGIQIALDWNDAFITYLKSQGIAGADETQIVQKWLAMISQQTAEKMAKLYVDTDGKVSEFM
jgi:hypothetical protein